MTAIPTRVALIGAGGRMGRFSAGLIADAPDLELVCEVASDQDLAAALAETSPQVGLDFTRATLGAEHGLTLLRAGVRPLIGTSGMTPEDDQRLDELAKEVALGGLVVPNFCLGVWLQQELARRAARFFPQVEIIEEHHQSKTDAPSGTALDTALQLGEVQDRPADQIPIHSVRLPGLYSNQSVLFGGPGEVLRLEHVTYGLEAFGPGILAGLRYVAGASPGVQRGIGHAFEAEVHA